MKSPYRPWDLPKLDAWHHALGVGPEWMASETRAKIAREPKVPSSRRERRRNKNRKKDQ